jgi:MFS family permease
MLYLITWLTDFAAFLLLFTVFRGLAEQRADALWVGTVGAVFSAANALSNAFAGRISDRAGRRRVAVAGMALLLVSVCGVAGFDSRQWPYLAAYTLSGIAFGAIYPPIIAWLGQGRSGRGISRVYFFFCLAWNAGVMSGQASGGWLFQHNVAWPLQAALALIALDLSLLLLTRDTPPSFFPDAGDDEVGVDARLSAAFARLAWVANIGGAFSISIVLFLLPKLIVSLDVSPETHGAVLAVGRLFAIGTYCLMHASHFWLYRFSLALAAQLLGVLGLLGLAAATTAGGLMAGLASLSILLGYNYFSSLYYSTTGSADHRKGSAGGVHEATLALGFAGGSLLGGVAGSFAGERAPYRLAAGVITALVVVQIVMYWRVVHPRRRRIKKAG